MNSTRLRDLGQLSGQVMVFGGPYSNLQATTALREVAEGRHLLPENIICTGDLVAYCADPEQTVNLIRDWGISVVMGNCEQSLAAQAVDCGCGFEEGSACSALSVEWFRYADSKISTDNRSWMRELPGVLKFQLAGRKFAVVHGGVEQVNRFIFATTSKEEKLDELKLLGEDMDGVIAGHCGIPFGQSYDSKVWLNAGVIGMPANDGTMDGWYLLLEPSGDKLRANWHRLSYPAEEARVAMRRAGLTGYAEALTDGLWPSEDVLPEVEKGSRGKALSLLPMII